MSLAKYKCRKPIASRSYYRVPLKMCRSLWSTYCMEGSRNLRQEKALLSPDFCKSYHRLMAVGEYNVDWSLKIFRKDPRDCRWAR